MGNVYIAHGSFTHTFPNDERRLPSKYGGKSLLPEDIKGYDALPENRRPPIKPFVTVRVVPGTVLDPEDFGGLEKIGRLMNHGVVIMQQQPITEVDFKELSTRVESLEEKVASLEETIKTLSKPPSKQQPKEG